jgi:sugar (pentulose or hexulose) kinase
MNYYLGVDVGGTKTHALIADETGRAVGFALAGTGSWEAVGYNGLEMVLMDAVHHAVEMAGIQIEEIAGAGFGLAGYDWSSQKQAHLNAITPLGLKSPIQIVNDAVLGIPADLCRLGISIVSELDERRGKARSRRKDALDAPWSVRQPDGMKSRPGNAGCHLEWINAIFH